MSDLLNNKNQIILDFTRFINRQNNVESEKQQEPIQSDREKVFMQVNTAKMYGFRELQKAKELTNKFAEELNSLCLLEGAGNMISEYVNNIIDNVLMPILRGENIIHMPEDSFRKLRTQVYKTLIDKYNISDKEEK